MRNVRVPHLLRMPRCVGLRYVRSPRGQLGVLGLGVARHWLRLDAHTNLKRHELVHEQAVCGRSLYLNTVRGIAAVSAIGGLARPHPGSKAT